MIYKLRLKKLLRIINHTKEKCMYIGMIQNSSLGYLTALWRLLNIQRYAGLKYLHLLIMENHTMERDKEVDIYSRLKK